MVLHFFKNHLEVDLKFRNYIESILLIVTSTELILIFDLLLNNTK